MERPDDPDPGALPAGRGRREGVVVRRCAWTTSKRSRSIVARSAGASRSVPRRPCGRVRSGRTQPGPPIRRARGLSPDERELGLHAGVDEGAGPVVNDGGDSGPLLAGDDVEDAHREEAISCQLGCAAGGGR